MSPRRVAIHYRRLPDRVQVFEQPVLAETEEYVVTFAEAVALPRPVLAGEHTILEPGAPVVWFTYPDRWYDVGRFHRADGTFTGVYANILTPVRMEGERWDTTDLCLDVWVGADGEVAILDEAEFSAAVSSGWMAPATAAAAREQADRLADAARSGAWPLPHVREWDLPRARRRMLELLAASPTRP